MYFQIPSHLIVVTGLNLTFILKIYLCYAVVSCHVMLSSSDSGMPAETEANRLEDDVPDDDDDGQRRRKRPKKLLSKDSLDNSGVYQSHPLNVILHIYDDALSDAKPSKLISLRFEYLVKLHVVCVGIEGAGPENILCNLFPDDTGIDLPHEVYIFFLSIC